MVKGVDTELYEYRETVTLPLDRPDLLAWDFYGDPYDYQAILLSETKDLFERSIEGALTYRFTPILPSPVPIKVKVRSSLNSTPARIQELPPWKR